MNPQTNSDTAITMLFVEDDELILQLQTSVLSARFPDVIMYTAANGALGLELFKTYLPDIVLTDINMSELSGVQMSLLIRALKPETRFIAITGKDTSEVTFEFDHYIVKPVGFEELFAAIEKCMSEIADK